MRLVFRAFFGTAFPCKQFTRADTSTPTDLGTVSPWFIVLASLALGTIECGAAENYIVTDLGTPGGSTSFAYGINNVGEVVGEAVVKKFFHAFLFRNGSMTDIGTLGGDLSVARGINANGQVVGSSDLRNEGTHRAFLYSGGTMRDLLNLPFTPSGAYAINESGQIAGSALNSKGEWHAFLFSNGKPTDLGTLGGGWSLAYGLNAIGQVVGEAQRPDFNFYAFLYRDGQMIDLGTLGGSKSAAYGINMSGQVVGEALTSKGDKHAFLYRDAQMADLGTLGGGRSTARAINQAGQVVGTAFTANGSQHAFLYSDGKMIDLNTLIPTDSGWVLYEARAINDFGQIAGDGFIGGKYHAFLLTPPPIRLDQKVLARDTRIQITIRGANLPSDAVLSFLKPDSSVDLDLRVSNIKVINTTEIQAEVFAAANAALGPRTLKVQSGARELTLKEALTVVGISLDFSQGAKTTLAADRVANHPTVVRAFVEGTTEIKDLTGLLYVFDGGVQILGSPFRPSAPAPNRDNRGGVLLCDTLDVKSNYSEEDRFYLRNSLNFYFGVNLLGARELPSGNFDFFLAVSATDPAVPAPDLNRLLKHELQARRDFLLFQELQTQNFRTTRDLRILILVDNRLPTPIANRLVHWQRLTEQYLRAAFPVDGQKFRFTIVRNVSKNVIDIDALRPFGINVFANWWARVHARLAESLAARNRLLPPEEQYDQIALITDSVSAQAINGEGTLGIADKATAVIVGEFPATFAHEIGHNLGLGETYCGYECGNLANAFAPCYSKVVNCRRSDALPNGNRVEDGAVRLLPIVDPTTLGPLAGVTASVPSSGSPPPVSGVKLRYQRVSVMGKADDDNDRWPDLAEWNYLFRQLRADSGSPAPLAVRAATAAGVVTVRGLVDIGDKLSDVQVVRGSTDSALPVTQPGDLMLELLSASGTALSSQNFGVEFRVPEAGLVTATAFAVSAPFKAGTSQVRIRKGDRVLFSRVVSSNPPTVRVLTPQAGQNVNGPVTVSWTANDPDGGSLTYSVFYLRDGIHPITIALNLTDTSARWDPAGAGGSSQARVVVVASDGVNEGKGVSDLFTVAKEGPSVSIFSPEAGVSVPEGTELVFTGAGHDPETGLLAPEALSFRSNLDGDLGIGERVVRRLSAGTHTITLRGRDADGNIGESNITVAVGATNDVPVVEDLFPTSGPAASDVTLIGRNLGGRETQVRFGTNDAAILSATSTQLVVRVPLGLRRGVSLVTVSARGYTSASSAFRVTPDRPRLTVLEPNSGPAGTPVLLRGEGFAATRDGNTVRFGGAQAQVISGDAQTLLATVPTGLALGSVLVTVATAQGTSDSLPFSLTSGEPITPVVLDLISPNSGATGTVVTIHGKGFGGALSANAVSFGGIGVAPLTVTSNSLQATVPGGLPAGPINVLVSVNGYPSNPLVFTVLSSTGCAPVPSGLVGWWPADGRASELIGNQQAALAGGAFFTPAKVGQGFGFDSDDDRVAIPHHTNWNVRLPGFTVDFWMKGAKNQPQALAAVVEKSHGFVEATGWALQCHSSSGLIDFNIGNPTGFPGVSSTVDVLDGNFHHIAGAWDGSVMQLYVDGMLQGSTPLVTPASNTRGVNLGFAWGGGTAQRFFRGIIDELAIFNRALSAAEIRAIFAAGSAGKCKLGSPAGPSITGFAPTSGAAGTTVIITGANLAGATAVGFGGVTITNFTVNAAGTQITVTVPANASGGSIRVTTPGGTVTSTHSFVFTTLACVAAPAGLIAWWTGDGNANDLQGTHQGTLKNGATFTLGKVGDTLNFDGVNDYVEAPDSDRWAFGTNQFTIELWANFNTVKASTLGLPGTIFIGQDEGPGNRNKWFFALGGGVLNFHVNSPATGPAFLVRAPFVPTAKQWYHLAVTRSGNGFRTFVDGVLRAAETNAVAVPNVNAPLAIGQAEGLGYMDGQMDEVSIYNRALPESELQAVFAAGSAGKCKDAASSLVKLLASFSGGTVTLSWPASAAGFVLEESNSLTSLTSWTRVTSAPVVVRDQNVLSVGLAGNSKFYRLRKP